MATKSKKALVNSFLKLLNEDEYDKISVTRLVEECGVSRQTFYYHFEDIEKMISWAFETETQKISECADSEDYDEIARLYAEFLNKYSIILLKASRSAKFISIYNLLFDNTDKFMSNFVLKKHKRVKTSSEEAYFFVAYSSGAFCSLVIREMQKKQPDYEELMRKLVKVLKTI